MFIALSSVSVGKSHDIPPVSSVSARDNRQGRVHTRCLSACLYGIPPAGPSYRGAVAAAETLADNEFPCDTYMSLGYGEPRTGDNPRPALSPRNRLRDDDCTASRLFNVTSFRRSARLSRRSRWENREGSSHGLMERNEWIVRTWRPRSASLSYLSLPHSAKLESAWS